MHDLIDQLKPIQGEFLINKLGKGMHKLFFLLSL